MKILIDSNVALDMLLERDTFYAPALEVFSLSKGGFEIFISASTITDIYYLVSVYKVEKNLQKTKSM